MSERAKMLRANSSPVERRMWRILFAFRTGGYHFRKQAKIGPYVVDMACHHAKLVIEVDGETHGTGTAIRQDEMRDAFLRSQGYTVLRVLNSDVVHNPNGVFMLVEQVLKGRPKNQRRGHPLPNPPHKGEGGLTDNSAVRAPHSPASTLPLVGRVGEGDSDA